MNATQIIISLVSLGLNAGLFALVFKISNQWSTMKERLDILWIEYCREHSIPYRLIGRKFEEDERG